MLMEKQMFWKMYQKLRKSHLRLWMKPLFMISLVYDLIVLIAAF